MLQNGSELLKRSFVFNIDDESKTGEVRRFTADITDELKFTETRASRAAIVVSELVTNLAKHATDGEIILRAVNELDLTYFEVIAVDRGPGFDDPSNSFRDGVSSSQTLGTGLGAIRRQSDIFDFSTDSNGTLMVAEIHANDESAALAKRKRIRISGLCLPLAPETVCGDAWAVRDSGSNELELIVIDGLGHGPIAHRAALAALESFSEIPRGTPPNTMLTSLHGALKSTRGAAISLAKLHFDGHSDETSIDFSGIGNVRAVVCDPADEKTMLTHPGTAGLQFKPRPPIRAEWSGRGAFIFHSDGLQSRWTSQSVRDVLCQHPALIAASLYRSFNRRSDDVTIVVATFYEGQH